MSGFYLWVPRTWTWRQVRAVTWFKGGLRGKARDFNWHNVIGIWSAIPLALVVATALPISFPWAGNLIYLAVGETPPQQGGGRGGAPRQAQPVRVANLDQLFARAEGQVPDWRSINLRLPTAADATLAFAIDRGNGGQPQLRSTLTLDAATGQVARWETFESQSLGRRLRSWSRFTHTGEAFGLVGQAIAGLVSAGAVVLVYTGLSLAWRRFFGKKSSTAASQQQEAA